MRQSDQTFRQLNEAIESNCEAPNMIGEFRKIIDDTIVDINDLFELMKETRDSRLIENNSVAGLFLRKVALLFERLTHSACSRLHDDLISYVSSCPSANFRRKGLSVAWQTPRTTRSGGVSSVDVTKNVKHIHQINHEISRLQANEHETMNPKDLYESVRGPNSSIKSDVTFIRYLNLLRVNEAVGSKHLLMAYFDMVSDTVSRGYSALNHAIWYLHHGEFKRAIECLQECYCCAQEADDDKCLLMSLMWLSRVVIHARLRDSSKYNVKGVLRLLRRRSQRAGLHYVQSIASLALEQLDGPKDDSETLKKFSAILEQIASSNRPSLLPNPNVPNPLDKDDPYPSGEILAVRHSMNDVLAMHYASLSAHLNLIGSHQSAALASQALLHFDLIEKCGSDDVLLLNENIFIAIRNLAYHVWSTTQNFQLVKEILHDLFSAKVPTHRTDYHSIWRQALSDISYEYYSNNKNWSEANEMIDIIRETDWDGAQLRRAELARLMGEFDVALELVNELVSRLDQEESYLAHVSLKEDSCRVHPSMSMEHKAFIRAKALLLQATLLDDEVKCLQSFEYAERNKLSRIRTDCLMELAKCHTSICCQRNGAKL